VTGVQTCALPIYLRVAGKAAREASAEAAAQLAAVGGVGPAGLEGIRLERARMEEAEQRLSLARAARDVAYAEFAALAPGRLPSEIDDVVAEYEAEIAARTAAETEAAARQEAESPAEPEPAEPEPTLAVSAEWWFGSGAPPPEPLEPVPAAAAPPPAPVRALAERLSAEGREALARIEAQLAALDRVELAKKSLEWHETQANGQPNGQPSGD